VTSKITTTHTTTDVVVTSIYAVGTTLTIGNSELVGWYYASEESGAAATSGTVSFSFTATYPVTSSGLQRVTETTEINGVLTTRTIIYRRPPSTSTTTTTVAPSTPTFTLFTSTFATQTSYVQLYSTSGTQLYGLGSSLATLKTTGYAYLPVNDDPDVTAVWWRTTITTSDPALTTEVLVTGRYTPVSDVATSVVFANPTAKAKRAVDAPIRQIGEYSLKRRSTPTPRAASSPRVTVLPQRSDGHVRKRQVYCEPSPAVTPSPTGAANSATSSTSSSSSSSSSSAYCALCSECAADYDVLPPGLDDSVVEQDDQGDDIFAKPKRSFELVDRQVQRAPSQKEITVCGLTYESGPYYPANGLNGAQYPAFGYQMQVCPWDFTVSQWFPGNVGISRPPSTKSGTYQSKC